MLDLSTFTLIDFSGKDPVVQAFKFTLSVSCHELSHCKAMSYQQIPK
jgi:hypothetical protein